MRLKVSPSFFHAYGANAWQYTGKRITVNGGRYLEGHMQRSSSGKYINENRNYLEYYELHRSYIIHEDNLINNRVGWFIQLHSFLLATYGIIIGSVVTTYFSENVPDRYTSTVLRSILPFALFGITFIGVCSAHSAKSSISAANQAIQDINKRWKSKYPRASQDFPGLIGGGDEASDARGARLHHFLPLAMEKMWAVSLMIPGTLLWLAFEKSGWI